VLGEELTKRFKSVEPNGWYPIEWLLQAMDILDERVGNYGLLHMGRMLFKLSHEARVLEVAKSARDIVFALDDMYHHANRGVGIGGWKVVKFEPGGIAVLEKNTPHHCVMEHGILSAALSVVGAPSIISQKQCFRLGADLCVYEINCAMADKNWNGE
jgi:hypothetical protein